MDHTDLKENFLNYEIGILGKTYFNNSEYLNSSLEDRKLSGSMLAERTQTVR